MKKWFKKRKKGSVIIEFIVVFPFIMAIIFFGIEVLVYQLVHSTAQEAAKEGARIVGTELRGHVGRIHEGAGNGDQILTSDEIEFIEEELKRKVNAIMNNNGFVNFEATTATYITDDKESSGKQRCKDAIQNGTTQVLCMYSDMVQVGDRNHEQVVVQIKTDYGTFSNFVPFADLGWIEGYGTESKEALRRYEYYK